MLPSETYCGNFIKFSSFMNIGTMTSSSQVQKWSKLNIWRFQFGGIDDYQWHLNAHLHMWCSLAEVHTQAQEFPGSPSLRNTPLCLSDIWPNQCGSEWHHQGSGIWQSAVWNLKRVFSKIMLWRFTNIYITWFHKFN